MNTNPGDEPHLQPQTPTERQPLLQQVNDISSEAQDDVLDSRDYPKFKFRLASVIFNFFLTGVCQGGIGALIPSIERYYHTSDGATATIFPALMVGYLIALTAVQHIHLRFGRRGIAILSSSFRFLAVVLLSTGPSFNLALAVYFIYGIGTGLSDASWCAWATSLPHANICQGLMHGSFSAGCVLGPIIEIAVLKLKWEWYGFYRLMGLLILVELIFHASAFRHDDAARYWLSEAETATFNPFKFAATWMCGIFFMIYVGIESSFNDWLPAYMNRVHRSESAIASLASSTFWMGMAVGRFALSFVTEYFGIGKSVATYIVISICLQALFRQINNIPVLLVILGFLGFLAGPLFPSGLLLLAMKLPFEAHVPAVAGAHAFGQVGGAILPLCIGLVADRFGIGHLLNVVFGMSIVMLLMWWVFSRKV